MKWPHDYTPLLLPRTVWLYYRELFPVPESVCHQWAGWGLFCSACRAITGRQEVLQLMVFNRSHLIAVSSGSQLSEDSTLEDTGEVSLSSVPQQVSGMGTFSSWKLTDVSVFSLGSETVGTLRALWNSPGEQALYGPLFQLPCSCCLSPFSVAILDLLGYFFGCQATVCLSLSATDWPTYATNEFGCEDCHPWDPEPPGDNWEMGTKHTQDHSGIF